MFCLVSFDNTIQDSSNLAHDDDEEVEEEEEEEDDDEDEEEEEEEESGSSASTISAPCQPQVRHLKEKENEFLKGNVKCSLNLLKSPFTRYPGHT
mgnify:FL=1